MRQFVRCKVHGFEQHAQHSVLRRRPSLAGLESHPDHDIAMDQMTGFGGVISFEIDGDLWRTAKFVDSVCTVNMAHGPCL